MDELAARVMQNERERRARSIKGVRVRYAPRVREPEQIEEPLDFSGMKLYVCASVKNVLTKSSKRNTL